MKNLFSIIVPTYNRGYIIWKTIQSVQKQIYPHWELLIIDDGSTDNTERVVAEFQKDPRIHYKKLNKSFANRARNYGLDKAKGDFIAYLDSDDYLYENFLSVNIEYFNKYEKAVFSIPNYNRREELYDDHFRLLSFLNVNSYEKDPMTLADIYLRNVKGSGTGTVHKKIVKEKGIRWDEDLSLFEDWDFKMQMGNMFPDGFIYIPYALFEYLQRYGGDGICTNTSYSAWANAFEKMYQKHKNDPLMKGQTWYPNRVEKFRKKQKLFDKGEIPPHKFRDFPEYWEAIKKN